MSSYLDFLKAVKNFQTIAGAANPTLAPVPIQRTPGGDIEQALPKLPNDPEAIKQILPPTADNMKDGRAEIYPDNLFQPGQEAYIFFIMRDSNKRTEPLYKRVGLYMPPSVKVKYHTQWEPINMQVQQAAALGQDVWGAFTSNLGSDQSKAGMSSMAAAAVKGATNLVDDFIGGGTFGQQAEVLMGRTVDPHQALMFKGVDFRTFQFEFQLLARTPTESESIRRIIKIFKWGMHPGKDEGALWWMYPCTFDIYLLTPTHKYMFNIMQCVLEDMDVDYGGSGAASFFKTTGAPVDIRMTLTFKELSLLTKENIQDDY